MYNHNIAIKPWFPLTHSISTRANTRLKDIYWFLFIFHAVRFSINFAVLYLKYKCHTPVDHFCVCKHNVCVSFWLWRSHSPMNGVWGLMFTVTCCLSKSSQPMREFHTCYFHMMDCHRFHIHWLKEWQTLEKRSPKLDWMCLFEFFASLCCELLLAISNFPSMNKRGWN